MGGQEAQVGVGRHYLRYSIGNVSAIVAGLVSFPILTRLLDNAQYGVLGYYDNWVLLAVAITKFGAQHSLLRFYPHQADADERAEFFANFFYLPMAVSLLLWALVLGGTAGMDWLLGAQQHQVFWMALFAVPLNTFTSMVETMLRASEQSRLVVVSRVTWRWLEVALIIGIVAFVSKTAVAAYAGKLLAILVLVVWYARWVRTHVRFVRQHLSVTRLREGMRYGLPLVANEMVAVAVVVADRLMLKGILGDFAAVGIYSVGASLAMQLNAFMNTSVFDALTPTANRIYQAQGESAVRVLKQRLLVPMTYASVGVAALLLMFGSDAILALSGEAKRASGPVFAVLGATFALYPLVALCGFGLLLEKRTQQVLWLMIGSLVLNVLLNLALIPRFGVMGSVYASAVSALALAAGHCIKVGPALRVWPSARILMIAALGLAGVVLSARVFTHALSSGWPRFLIGGGCAACIYVGIVLAIDRNLRDWMKVAINRRRQM